MDTIVDRIALKSKLIGMILLFAAAGFALIGRLATIGGGLMPVVGGLLFALFNLAVVGIIPLLIALKKDALVKYAILPIFAWWIISQVNDFLGNSGAIAAGVPGVVVASALFQFFIACALLVSLAFAIVYLFKKQNLWLQLSFTVFAGSLVLFFIAWTLAIAVNAKYDAAWTSYFFAFANYLFLPAGMAFVLLFIIRYQLIGDVATDETSVEAESSTAGQAADEEDEPIIAEGTDVE